MSRKHARREPIPLHAHKRRRKHQAPHKHTWLAPGIVCGTCWHCRVCEEKHPRYPLEQYLYPYAPFLALENIPRGGIFDMSYRERECFMTWLATGHNAIGLPGMPMRRQA